MSIRPVDLQVMLPRSTEVGKIQNNINNRPENQQQLFAQHLQRQVEHDQQHVIQTNKSEKQTVDKDGSNKNKQQARKKNTNDAKQDDQKNDKPKNSPYENKGMLDITI